jgi:FkbM family methyltransferase
MSDLDYVFVRGGGVPGGHNVLCGGKWNRKPFITSMSHCKAVRLRHSDVVADIGAYCGTYALICARFPVKEVRAFEPTPKTFEVLSLTQLPNLQHFNVAVVGDDSETIEFFLSKGLGVTNSAVYSKQKKPITVPAMNYVEAVEGATVVKVDVEGLEYTYPLIQEGVRALIIEFHPLPGKDWIAMSKDVMSEIESAGFQTVIRPTFESGWSRDGVFVREQEDSGEKYEPMMSGEMCCGCGKQISGFLAMRSLCISCWQFWEPRHRLGYAMSELKQEER